MLPYSSLIGNTIVESRLGEMHDLTIMGIIRDGRARLGILPNAHIKSGDILLAKGSIKQLLDVRREIGVGLEPEPKISDLDLTSPEAAVAEVVISQKADFIGRTVAEIDFRVHFGLTVLAIWRNEEPIVGRVGEIRLKLGDILLVHGRRERINDLQNDRSFLLLAPIEIE